MFICFLFELEDTYLYARYKTTAMAFTLEKHKK